MLLSQVEDVEVFNICLECWHDLVSGLYDKHEIYNENHCEHSPSFGLSVRQNNFVRPRRQFYAPILSKVSLYELIQKEIE